MCNNDSSMGHDVTKVLPTQRTFFPALPEGGTWSSTNHNFAKLGPKERENAENATLLVVEISFIHIIMVGHS